MEEIVQKRTRNSKTHSLGNNKYAWDGSIGSIHYKDDPDNPTELFKNIEVGIQPSPKPNWDWEVIKGHWHLLIKEDTTVAVGKDGHWIGFRLDGIAYLDIVTKNYEILQQRQSVTPTISSNKIRWEDIFNGVNLEYEYDNDRFKENVEVTQTARDWCQAHPPSDYGLSNQNSYLVFYAECDWKDSYSCEDGDGNSVNWEADNEFENKSIFFRHPVKDYLVSALPLSWAKHGDLEQEDWVPIRKRFFKQNDKHWLLFGSKVTLLNQMPAGMIVFDPPVDEQVGTGTDDCYRYLTTPYWSLNYTQVIAGSFSTSYYQMGSGMRFQTVAIEGTIDVAYITLDCYTSSSVTGANTRISAEDVDDAATFADDAAAFDTRWAARTTARVDWDNIAAWSAGTAYNSPSIVTVLQEIVNRGGWSSGNDIVIFWEDYEDRSAHDAARRRQADSYEGGATDAPKLHVEYTAGAPPPAAVNFMLGCNF